MTRKKILEGHKKVGKKFIPPIIQYQFLAETNWVNNIIPEIIWIAVIQKKLGYKIANIAIVEFHKEFINSCETKFPHSFFSSYEALSQGGKQALREQFSKNKHFNNFCDGLKDLHFYYPNHPLEFLFVGQEIKESETDLEVIKSALKAISVRRTEAGTIAQAAVLFNSMATRKFNAPKGSIFYEFHEIDNYPKTEKSLQLASSIRATINAFMNPHFRNTNCKWIDSFWQRSFQIEPPTLKFD